MSLTVETKELENRQLGMTVEIPEKRVIGEMKKAVRKMAGSYSVPGFRKGKAPYKLMLKRFGEEAVRYQAVEGIMDEVLNEALAQEEIEPYARLSLDDLTLFPAVKLEVTVPLAPEVTLGDYRAIRKELSMPEIADDAVDSAIESVLESHASTEAVEDRAAELGDMVKITGHGSVIMSGGEVAEGEDQPENVELFHDHDGLEFLLDASKTFPGTDFVDNLVGVEVGDAKKFTITYADDYEVSDFAGKTAEIDIELIEISLRTMPELTEEFAVEANYESLEDMSAKIRAELEKEAEGAYRSEVMDSWIEDLLKDATLVYPPAVVDQELENSLDQLKEQVKSYQWEWDDYLKGQGTTEEKIKEEWREDAAKNVENSLALREFISSERLKVREEELNARIDERINQYGELDDEMREMMRNILMGQNGVQQLANEVMVDKAFERISLIVAGDAPDLDELAAAEAAADAAADEARAAAAAAEAESAEQDQTESSDEAETEAADSEESAA